MKMSMGKQVALAAVVVVMGCVGIIALILTLVQHHLVDLPHRMQVMKKNCYLGCNYSNWGIFTLGTHPCKILKSTLKIDVFHVEII